MKQLIITSPTTAKEINPVLEKPIKHTNSFEWNYWQLAESKLKEYRIINPKPYHKIGDIVTAETNEENLTCIIL